jgi:hypothetical protein
MTAGLDEEATILSAQHDPEPKPEEVSPERARVMLMLGLLTALGILISFQPGLATTTFLALVAVLGLLGFLGGPLILAAGLVAAFAGWLWRSPTSPQPSSPASSLVAGSSLRT